MFWVELTFKGYEDTMIFCVSIFIFCLEPTVRKQLDENDFRHCYVIFWEVLFWNYLIKPCSKFFRNNYKTLWQQYLKRYITVENFTDMGHHSNWFFLEYISLNKNWLNYLDLHNNPILVFEDISLIIVCFFFSQINLVYKFHIFLFR